MLINVIVGPIILSMIAAMRFCRFGVVFWDIIPGLFHLSELEGPELQFWHRKAILSANEQSDASGAVRAAA